MPPKRARQNILIVILLLISASSFAYWIYLGGVQQLVPSLFTTQITITWTTENEIDVSGYNLYRSDTEEGLYLQVNEETIPPSSDPVVTTEHSFVDDENLESGETYYYMLETVDRFGNTTRQGPFILTAD